MRNSGTDGSGHVWNTSHPAIILCSAFHSVTTELPASFSVLQQLRALRSGQFLQEANKAWLNHVCFPSLSFPAGQFQLQSAYVCCLLSRLFMQIPRHNISSQQGSLDIICNDFLLDCMQKVLWVWSASLMFRSCTVVIASQTMTAADFCLCHRYSPTSDKYYVSRLWNHHVVTSWLFLPRRESHCLPQDWTEHRTHLWIKQEWWVI